MVELVQENSSKVFTAKFIWREIAHCETPALIQTITIFYTKNCSMESDDESHSLLQPTKTIEGSLSYGQYMAKYFSRPVLKTGLFVCLVATIAVIVDLVNLKPQFSTNSVAVQSSGADMAINLNLNVKTHQYFSELYVSLNTYPSPNQSNHVTVVVKSFLSSILEV